MPKEPDVTNSPIDADEESCRTCRFYEFYDDREQDEHGTCIRHAPQPRLTTDPNSNELFYADWPLVRWNAWCGEWQRDPELKPKATAPKAPARDLDAILKRLTKLKPTKRATAVNSIKAMFQFDAPINDNEANKILEALGRRGNLTIDANDKLQIRNA